MSGKRGFTLIELLVVIAIIAILAAILFPIFTQAQAAGKLAKCLNNAKQIVQGCLLYEVDSDGTMIQGFRTPPPGITVPWGDWYDSINPYLRQMSKSGTGGNTTYSLRGVWLCPSMVRSTSPSGGEMPADLKRCYGYNYAYLGGYPIPGCNPPQYDVHKSGEVVKSTKTIRILEFWHYIELDQWIKGHGTAYCYPPVKSTICMPNQAWLPGWHSGKSVVGWVDGHVSTVTAVPPRPGGAAGRASDYVGIMQKTYNNDGDETNHADPWFRCTNPKP